MFYVLVFTSVIVNTRISKGRLLCKRKKEKEKKKDKKTSAIFFTLILKSYNHDITKWEKRKQIKELRYRTKFHFVSVIHIPRRCKKFHPLG